jgi:ribosomal protein L37AE/L43A
MMKQTETQIWKTKTCPKCGDHLEYNLAYGTLDCEGCNETYGNSD